jgi:hypothetical protein
MSHITVSAVRILLILISQSHPIHTTNSVDAMHEWIIVSLVVYFVSMFVFCHCLGHWIGLSNEQIKTKTRNNLSIRCAFFLGFYFFLCFVALLVIESFVPACIHLFCILSHSILFFFAYLRFLSCFCFLLYRQSFFIFPPLTLPPYSQNYIFSILFCFLFFFLVLSSTT